MNENSSKPAKTRDSQVSALKVVHNWLEREGSRGRIATALTALVEATITAIERGDPPPGKDSLTLLEIWRLNEQRDGPVTRPRASEFKSWWSARADHIRQVCLAQQCEWLPDLKISLGGGRNLPTRYAFDLVPLNEDDSESEQIEPDLETPPYGGLHYQIDPVRPALWLRLLVGSKPFRITSWRGYVLLGAATFIFVVMGVMWWALLSVWSHGRPITTSDVAAVFVVVLITLVLWRFIRPIRLLPTQRITLAHEGFLAWDELHGQLRTMRLEPKRQPRSFSVVRHWGICPICAAEVDLAHGGNAFPGRLIGRCADAPMEHVYSFDPVQLAGVPLREPSSSP